ncbi:CD1107 family mobile element protein [Caproiciproducens sp.]
MKKFHKLAALGAAPALMCSFTTVAYAASVTNEPAGSTSLSSSSAASGSSAASTDSSLTSGTSSASTVFTPAGTGTVVNTATDEDGKEFYTITTPDKNVFYLVIDRQRNGDNVYFLNAVTETSAKSSSAPQSNNMGMLVLVLAVVVIGGGAGYYFKIYRPKHQKAESEDDFDYADENGSDDADNLESDELPEGENGDGDSESGGGGEA